jgi:hypothetical protein
MALEDTFTNLASFLNSLDTEGEQKLELSHSLVIICPDCGKNIAFRGRCPAKFGVDRCEIFRQLLSSVLVQPGGASRRQTLELTHDLEQLPNVFAG